MIRYIAIVLAVALLPATVAQAQFEAGDWELRLNGAGRADNNVDAGSVEVNGSLGYVLDPNWEVSLRQSIGYVDTGGDNAYNASTKVGLDYHFDAGRWQPFVGAQLGFHYGDQFRDTWSMGPEAGVKYFMSDNAFVYGQIGYDWFLRNAGDAAGNFNDGQFVYGVGIGFRW